jgi:hypothetical protein
MKIGVRESQVERDLPERDLPERDLPPSRAVRRKSIPMTPPEDPCRLHGAGRHDRIGSQWEIKFRMSQVRMSVSLARAGHFLSGIAGNTAPSLQWPI